MRVKASPSMGCIIQSTMTRSTGRLRISVSAAGADSASVTSRMPPARSRQRSRNRICALSSTTSTWMSLIDAMVLVPSPALQERRLWQTDSKNGPPGRRNAYYTGRDATSFLSQDEIRPLSRALNLGRVHQYKFRFFVGADDEFRFIADRRPVPRPELDAIHGGAPLGERDIGVPPGGERVRDRLALLQRRGEHSRIL